MKWDVPSGDYLALVFMHQYRRVWHPYLEGYHPIKVISFGNTLIHCNFKARFFLTHTVEITAAEGPVSKEGEDKNQSRKTFGYAQGNQIRTQAAWKSLRGQIHDNMWGMYSEQTPRGLTRIFCEKAYSNQDADDVRYPLANEDEISWSLYMRHAL